jgi:hypothetical protein
MSKSKKQNRRQLAVLEDLFAGALEEQEVLEKHHVSPSLFERWLADERFAERFERRIAHAHRQSRIILAQCAPAAAAKLTQLTQSKNEETARKACLDIIALDTPAGRQGSPEAQSDPRSTLSSNNLSPEAAGRLLAALARGEPKTGGDSA